VVISIYQVLSEQQAEVYKLYSEKKDTRQIAEIMKISPEQVRAQFSKTKKKIKKLNESGITVIQNDIADTYDEMTGRTGKRTVKEAQVLNSLQQMSVSGVKPQISRYMKEKITPSDKPKWTPVKEDKQPKKTEKPRTTRTTPEWLKNKNKTIIQEISTTYRRYMEGLETGCYCIDDMADMEIVLRAYRYIIRTPYINKRNRKTAMLMRAQPQKVTVKMTLTEAKEYFRDGYSSAKAVESCVDIEEDGTITRSKVYLINKSEAWNRNILAPKNLAEMASEYHAKRFKPNPDIEEMAKMEKILRAYGFIKETPFSDKLNNLEEKKEQRKKEYNNRNQERFFK
jgi:hypothetical protein